MTTPGASTRRPLLVNGESLRVDVVAPPTGGGEKYEPRTAVEARTFLLPQVSRALAEVHSMPMDFRADDRVYIEAKLVPNYLAASYFPATLLAQVGATPVGSRVDVGDYRTSTKSTPVQTRRLVLAISDAGLEELEFLIDSGGRGRTQEQAFSEIRKLDEVGLPTEDRVLRVAGSTAEAQHFIGITWEAVLHPQTSRAGEPLAVDEATLSRWFDLIEAHEGTVHREFVRSISGLTFTPVTLPGPIQAAQVAKFNPLRVLRPMPAIRPRPRFTTRAVAPVQPPANASPVSTAIRVAVFDGGVDPAGAPWPLFPVTASDLTTQPPDLDELKHGTGVTGAVLYGLVAPGQMAPQPPLPVDSFRVLPAPNVPGDLEGYWVLDRIKETVEQDGHKLVNLSLGPSLAVEEDMEPNRWTSELDQLAWDNDVLFVVAAGNDGEEDRTTGLHRVQVPADMANGLAVGSCDAPAPDSPWARAPYSSMGPGRHGSRVQPLGVQFGGGPDRLFKVLRGDGRFWEAAGTSFAAPVTTHALAELVNHLPRINSSVLRAFATHFAERPRHHIKLRDEVGYGRHPLSFVDAMNCDPDTVHVLIIDEIAREDLFGYRLPVPATVSAGVDLQLTLAYSSPVDPTQPTEYTSASLELVLRPHQFMHSFRPPKGDDGRTQTLDRRSAEATQLMQDGWVWSQEAVTQTLGAPKGANEAQLRDSGKWETIRHHRLPLPAVDGPRLELSYLARRAGALDNSPTKVPFALLMSIKDQAGNGTLYDEVRSNFRALLPAERARARLRTRSEATQVWY